MAEPDLEELQDAVNGGQCILWLGPGTKVAETATGEVERVDIMLARQLADELEINLPDEDPLQHVATRYADRYSRQRLEKRARTLYETHASQPDSLHSNLAQLPFKTIVECTPSACMSEALLQANKTPQVSFYKYFGGDCPYTPGRDANKPAVFHLFGLASEPDSIVLTEDDILNLFMSLIGETPKLPTALTSELREKRNSFLFLGFPFKQWYWRLLIRALRDKTQQTQGASPFFALKFLEDGIGESTAFFYRHGYKVRFFEDDLTELLQALREACQPSPTRRSQPAPEAAKPSATAAKIFVSHVSEDKPTARIIANALRECGHDPWLDERSLDVGTEYDNEIFKRIDDSDYFLTLMSRTWMNKRRTYANREVRRALQLQDAIAPGLKWILPVAIEPNAQLEGLQNLHRIECLDLPQDVAKIDKAVRDDMRRRQNMR